MAKKTETAEPAAFTFDDVAVETAAVPDTTRKPKTNPFAAVVGALAETMEDGKSASAKSVTVPADMLGKTKRYLSAAGQAAGVSVRSIDDENADGTVAVTFWTVTRITRARKDK